MADVAKLILDIESNVKVDGIDKMITSLGKLDKQLTTVVPNLKKTSSAFNSFTKASTNLNNLSFSKIERNLRTFNTTLNNIANSGATGKITAQATALNKLSRSMASIQKNSGMMSGMKGIDTSTFKFDASTLGGDEKTNASLSSTARSINDVQKALNKLNAIDFSKTNLSIKRLGDVFKELKTYTSSLDGMNDDIRDMAKAMNSLRLAMEKMQDAQAVKGLDMSKMSYTVNKYSGMAGNVPTGTGKLGGATDLLSTIHLMEMAGRGFATLTNYSKKYIETLNLFEVVLGDSAYKAEEFITNLEKVGVNQEQAMRYQGSFFDIARSLGLSSDNAYTLSEQFTKLAYDYSSLYNLNVDDAFEKLQAAVVGTTEPIRRLGKDISEANLQQTALNLGITESVSKMTQQEKVQLRFVSVMQQSGAAMNDLERTIQSPANATRMLQAQLVSLAREVGNLLLPALQAILPPLIAMTRLFREIVADIAGIFGIEFPKIDFGGIEGGLGGVTDSVGDLDDSVGSAVDKAKELKNHMLGIDELNVLDPTQDEGSGSGGSDLGGIGGGLDLDLSQYGYDEVLKDVKTQVDEIYEGLEKWKTPITFLASAMGIGKLISLFKGLKIPKMVLSFFGIGGAVGAAGALGGIIPTLSAIGAFITGPFAIPLLAITTLLSGIVYNGLQPAVKEVDRLGGVSDATAKKLEPLLDVFDELDKEIREIDWTGLIDDGDIASIQKSAKEISQAIIKELDSDRNQALADIQLIRGITPEERQRLIDEVNDYYDDVEGRTTDAQEEINSITDKYRGKDIEMTKADQKRLKELYDQLRKDAVNSMTQSTEERELVMQKWRDNEEHQTVESAAKVLQEEKKKYNDTISAAQDWRARSKLELKKRFEEEGTMSKSEYNKQLALIDGTYDEMVDEADTAWNDIYNAVEDSMGDQMKTIDVENGTIKKNYQVFWNDMCDVVTGAGEWIVKKWNKMWDDIGKGIEEANKWLADKWADAWEFMDNLKQDVANAIGKAFEDAGKTIGQWGKDIQKAWDDVWKFLSGIPGTVSKWVGEAMSTAWSTISNWGSNIATAWNNVWKFVGGIVGTIGTAIGNAMSTAWKTISSWASNIGTAWNNVWSFLGGLGSKVWNAVWGAFDGIRTQIGQWTGSIREKWDGMWSFVYDIGSKLWSAVWGAFDGVWTQIGEWKGSLTSQWNKIWSGFTINHKSLTDKVWNAMNAIYKAIFPWLAPLQTLLNKIFGTKSGSYGGGGKPFSVMSAGMDLGMGGGFVGSPNITPYARGGFVPNDSMFVPPQMWTAGEAGREVVGNFNNKTTVMPLEDTGFVQAMYRAVYDATVSAQGSQPINISVEPKVQIGNKDIAQAQESYSYDSGSTMLRKI